MCSVKGCTKISAGTGCCLYVGGKYLAYVRTITLSSAYRALTLRTNFCTAALILNSDAPDESSRAALSLRPNVHHVCIASCTGGDYHYTYYCDGNGNCLPCRF